MFSSSLKAVLVGTLLVVSVSALTDSERAAVLDSHNAFRQQIANGEAVNKDGTKLPTAANMLKLTYDTTMEVAAQKWADNCTGTVNSGGNVPYGQNSCWYGAHINTTSMLTTHGTERFYEALSEIGVDPSLNFTKSVGQWSQLAWATTSRLGCGVSQCPANSRVPYEFTFIVCYYGEPGNVLNQLIYQPGEPCSKCPAKTTCSSGLCANSSEIAVTTTTKSAPTTTSASATTTTALAGGCATAFKLIEIDSASNSTILTTAINNAYNGWVRTAKVNFASYKKRIENTIWGGNIATAEAKLDDVQWVLSDCASQQNVYAIQISSWGTVADLVACRGTTTTKAGPVVSTTKATVPVDTTTTKVPVPDTTTKAADTTTTKFPVPADTTTTTTTTAPATAGPVSTSTTKVPVPDTTTTTNAPTTTAAATTTTTKAPAPVTTAATSTTTKAPVADTTTTKIPVPDTTTSSTPKTTTTAPSSITCGDLSSNTDSFRQQLLDVHNQFRRDLANGQAPNKTGFLPKGQNIYKLDYSCDLEASLTDVCSNGYRRMSSAPFTRQQIEKYLMDYVKSQWNQSVVYGVDASLTRNNNISGWADMAADRLTHIGCAAVDCGKNGSTYKIGYICTYDYAQSYYSRTPYVPGPPCTKDSDCTRLPNSVCLASEGLCKETSVYPAPGVNTMCPGVTSPLDDRARMRAVDMHNVNRRNLIHGLEPMGNMNTFAPTGSNMYKMVWDCGVEAKAQEWANGDKWPGHSSAAFRNYNGMSHGENMMGPGFGWKPPFYLLDQAATLFWDELAKFGWKGVGNRTLTSDDFAASIGHWSQMAWADTYQLGCGVAPSSMVVCQYGPGGNYIDSQQIYPAGVPCKTNADCTKKAGNTCDTASGLCVRA